MTASSTPQLSTIGQIFTSNLAMNYQEGNRIGTVDNATLQDPDAYYKVQLDGAIAHAMYYSRFLMAGKEYKTEAASNSPLDLKAKKFVDKLLGNVRDIEISIFDMTEVDVRGSSYFYINGKRESLDLGNNFGRKKVWAPFEFKHIDKDRIEPVWKNGKYSYTGFDLSKNDYVPIDMRPTVKLVNSKAEGLYGFGNGKLNSLWWIYWAKKQVEALMLTGLEKIGKAVDILYVGKNDTGNVDLPLTEVAAANAAILQNIIEDGAGVLRAQDKFERLASPIDLNIIESILSYYDNLARILLIGANLPVSATSGGSFALAQVQQDTILLYLRYGRTIIENAFNHRVIPYIWDRNLPVLASLGLLNAKPPKFIIPESRSELPEVAAQVMDSAKNLGLKIEKREAHKKLNIDQPFKGDPNVIGGKGKSKPAKMPFSREIKTLKRYLKNPTPVSKQAAQEALKSMQKFENRNHILENAA